MYLGNPLLPINVPSKSAALSIKKAMEKIFWSEYEQKDLVLTLVPYFLFNYHYYLESESPEKKTIKNSSHGVLAVDGHDISVRKDLVDLIKNNWKKASSLAPKSNFREKWNNIEKREEDSILGLKTAEFFGIPKSQVVVSSARKFLVPFYRTGVIVNKKEYPLVVNAVDGTIEGIKNIPARNKGYVEITRETIEELKDPSNWLKYSREAITQGSTIVSSRAKRPFAGKKKKKSRLSVFESRVILAAIMALAILLIIIGFFRIRLP